MILGSGRNTSRGVLPEGAGVVDVERSGGRTEERIGIWPCNACIMPFITWLPHF